MELYKLHRNEKSENNRKRKTNYFLYTEKSRELSAKCQNCVTLYSLVIHSLIIR